MPVRVAHYIVGREGGEDIEFQKHILQLTHHSHGY